ADGMKPRAKCGITFADAVTDKQDERVCAPTAAGCTPGDTGSISFTVEPFLLATSEPEDGATDVALTDDMSTDATIALHLNAALDPATVAAAIAVTANGKPVDGLAPALADDDDATVTIAVPGGFKSGTEYSVP